ncbi:hypothetical protein E4U42_004372 [Claviceps africana]|uniref:Initiation-specific alpha-1,6-mannosyltransferase n=1 Tax=Claviceps africana TaxID=83212 RepID=A0A8K0NH24_9HYPO|nr:hypothetical protein E4U42_004372 [Claviceps africana]
MAKPPSSSSPLGAAARRTRFQNVALPKKIRKYLPTYLVCVFLVLVLVNFDVLFLVSTPSGDQQSPQHQPRRPPGVSSSLSTSSLFEPRVYKRRPGHTFPQKIWQTWKIDPLLFGITETSRAMTWIAQNPHMRYEVITDHSDVTYVEQHFGPAGLNRPDIVEFYRSVNLRIIKADLLRYMILYAEGGIYTDIDVEAIKPFHRFIPERHNEEDYDLIVGVEVDMPEYRNHRILGPKSQSFCQWTIVSRPRHPVMMRLIESIIKWFEGVAHKQRVPLDQVELDFDQVITGTGPSAFTAAVLEEMNVAVAATKGGRGSDVTWDEFHNMDESKVVGRVLVLTVEAFCAGQGHSDSGNHGSRGALVKHHYHASNWPSKHPRYSHPAYGQIEECNWNAECVEKWDKDVAAFEKLSEDEKKQVIVERLRMLQPLVSQHQEQQEKQPQQGPTADEKSHEVQHDDSADPSQL